MHLTLISGHCNRVKFEKVIGDVDAERAQLINTIFFKIELFTIWPYLISDVGQP
jgi:hypothetical protein